jgi:hypothetical protein
MFDFVSTREGVSPETQAAARLLAMFVAAALADAALPPDPEEAQMGRNYNLDARAAVDYLFSKGSSFENHIELLGGSPSRVRAALLGDRELPERGLFTMDMRRIIQMRHTWWAALRQPETTEETL